MNLNHGVTKSKRTHKASQARESSKTCHIFPQWNGEDRNPLDTSLSEMKLTYPPNN